MGRLVKVTSGLRARHEYDNADRPFSLSHWTAPEGLLSLSGGKLRLSGSADVYKHAQYTPGGNYANATARFIQAVVSTPNADTVMALMGLAIDTTTAAAVVTEGVGMALDWAGDADSLIGSEWIAGSATVGGGTNVSVAAKDVDTTYRPEVELGADYLSVYDGLGNVAFPDALTLNGLARPASIGVNQRTLDVLRWFEFAKSPLGNNFAIAVTGLPSDDAVTFTVYQAHLKTSGGDTIAFGGVSGEAALITTAGANPAVGVETYKLLQVRKVIYTDISFTTEASNELQTEYVCAGDEIIEPGGVYRWIKDDVLTTLDRSTRICQIT